MLLKSIKLSNIRSYLNQKIDFPSGSVVLSGDIGSGKSTILLAAEFALFGIMKGDVSGESLLRNGKKEGSVELCLNVGGKDVLINRVLKRSKQGVKQEAGYMIVNGLKKAGTATELKSLILGMLGYPKELLTKSKGLIYRYTVYTPQEEMKRILFEDKEARLNTLRRVFDVDKYKRIRENAKTYIYEIKGKIKEIEGITSDLEDKKKQIEGIRKEIGEIEAKISGIMPKLEASKKDAEKLREESAKCEKDVEKLANLRKDLALCESELKNKLSQRQRNKEEAEIISKQVEQLKKEVGKSREITGFSAKIKEKDNEIRVLEGKRLEISRKIAEMKSKKEHSEEIKEKISKLDSCPLCLQEVSHEHKKSITSKEDESIAKIDEEMKSHSAQEKDAEARIDEMKKQVIALRDKEKVAEALKVKASQIDEKQKRVELLNKEQEEIKKSIGLINMRKVKASEELDLLKDVEENYRKMKDSVREADKKLHELEIQNNTFETGRKEKAVMLNSAEEEIRKKEESKAKLSKIKNIQQWLENNFAGLMSLMEKQVMVKVYHSFNELFQNWFNILMEEEAISARLDDSFSPVIQQNGYETNMDYLSGGEKTSCALAYRLALNKVINDLITTIQTKDLIILDEPTDGFSTEQLDRVREVIDQLNMKQVIIVSHEQKMEGFVDNVIRIQKKEHVSSVV